MGQNLALHQISDAVCDHLANEAPRKPLVLSVHGPPGVGKSLFHQEAARALYSTRPSPNLQCPGSDCSGYKVLFGMDFTTDDREAQHAALRNALSEHMQNSPEAFLVIEEYDKLDCTMRGFFRQLLTGGMVGNFSLARSIIVLESNAGYTSLHKMLDKAGSREKISPERAQKELKDLVFDRWKKEGCEDRTDTLKMIGLVDFFLPFFPLERKHVVQLFELRIKEKLTTAELQKWGWRIWVDPGVANFLTDKVEFEGPYPIEGGKEVGTLLTRYVTRPIREWVKFQEMAKKEGQDVGSVSSFNGSSVVGRGWKLRVTSTRDRLEIVHR